MTRFEEFEKRLEELVDDFSDLSYADIADALEYKSEECIRKYNRQ